MILELKGIYKEYQQRENEGLQYLKNVDFSGRGRICSQSWDRRFGKKLL